MRNAVIYFIISMFFSLPFSAATRAIFIGLDGVENVRETAPTEKEIRILISETHSAGPVKRPDLFRWYQNPQNTRSPPTRAPPHPRRRRIGRSYIAYTHIRVPHAAASTNIVFRTSY